MNIINLIPEQERNRSDFKIFELPEISKRFKGGQGRLITPMTMIYFPYDILNNEHGTIQYVMEITYKNGNEVPRRYDTKDMYRGRTSLKNDVFSIEMSAERLIIMYRAMLLISKLDELSSGYQSLRAAENFTEILSNQGWPEVSRQECGYLGIDTDRMFDILMKFPLDKDNRQICEGNVLLQYSV